jgi:hypothetical protein
MTPRGLIKATAYYNNLEAWKDWNQLAIQYPEFAKQFTPPVNAGWRKVDKCTAKLKAAIQSGQYKLDFMEQP